jgi:hypothetical protein
VRIQSPSRRFPGLSHPDIQNLIDVFANAERSGSRETIGKHGDVSLRNHSSAPQANNSSAKLVATLTATVMDWTYRAPK